MPTTTATLEYTVSNIYLPAALVESTLGAVDLAQQIDDFEELTSASLTSDSTAADGTTGAKRTIVFNLTDSKFQANFPTQADAEAAFAGLFAASLGIGSQMSITQTVNVT